MIITLQSSSAIAKIDTKGAELISLIDVFGTEYMWQKDPKFWNRCSPVLFPIVGNLRNDETIIEGKKYSIPKHGFCRDAEFTVAYETETSVILRYTFNDETLMIYPYKFALSLTYALNDGEIEISYAVLNLDNKPIDFCLGAHPAFNVPIGKDNSEYCLEFNKPESDGSAVYDIEKLEVNINNRVNYINDNKILLNNCLFDKDAMIFDKINSNSVKLYSIKTGRGVQVDYDNFDFIAFWTPTKLNAPFLCIEPWCGMAACNDEDDQFINKRGIKHLNIDEQFNCKITIIPM